jgi:hypothetical protein
VIYPGSTPVGNATLVVANVLTCNKYSQITSTDVKGSFNLLWEQCISVLACCACDCVRQQ